MQVHLLVTNETKKTKATSKLLMVCYNLTGPNFFAASLNPPDKKYTINVPGGPTGYETTYETVQIVYKLSVIQGSGHEIKKSKPAVFYFYWKSRMPVAMVVISMSPSASVH